MILLYFLTFLILIGIYQMRVPLFLIFTGAVPMKESYLSRKLLWNEGIHLRCYILNNLSEEFLIIKKSAKEFILISRNKEVTLTEQIIHSLRNERAGDKILSPLMAIVSIISIAQKAILTLFLGSLSSLFIRPFFQLNKLISFWRFNDLHALSENPAIAYSIERYCLQEKGTILPLQFLGITPSLLRRSE